MITYLKFWISKADEPLDMQLLEQKYTDVLEE